jgi:hypothetical protein
MPFTKQRLIADDERRKKLLERPAPGPIPYDLDQLGRLGLKLLEFGAPQFYKVLLDLIDEIPAEMIPVWATRTDLPVIIRDLILERLQKS